MFDKIHLKKKRDVQVLFYSMPLLAERKIAIMGLGSRNHYAEVYMSRKKQQQQVDISASLNLFQNVRFLCSLQIPVFIWISTPRVVSE